MAATRFARLSAALAIAGPMAANRFTRLSAALAIAGPMAASPPGGIGRVGDNRMGAKAPAIGQCGAR
jgi:hypothetical protein